MPSPGGNKERRTLVAGKEIGMEGRLNTFRTYHQALANVPRKPGLAKCCTRKNELGLVDGYLFLRWVG